ncbi:MAG: PAS domain S-box protein [Proteobacteria bacterium]|nr:PAS domain S-box protein [Pseudomonadota bacterium]
MSKRYKVRFLILIVFICLFSPELAARTSKSWNVLVLNSYHKGLPWTDNITEGIQKQFEFSELEIDFHFEYMDTKHSFEKDYLDAYKKTLALKYKMHPVDIVITSDDHAFQFVREYRDELFGAIPHVFCGVNFLKDEDLIGYNSVTGVVEKIDMKSTLELAFDIHPDTESVFVVVDDTMSGRANKTLISSLIPMFQQRAQFTFLEGMTMKDLQERLAELPLKSFVVMLTYTNDKDGNHFTHEKSTYMISRGSNAPVYCFWDVNLGHGIVGGKLTSGIAQGEKAASLAIRILRGESTDNIPIVMESPNPFMFDFQQMERFNVSLSDLPPDSIIINKPISFYAANKQLIWSMFAGIVALIIIILILTISILHRLRAEAALRVNEARWRSLTETSPDQILTLDNNLDIEFINFALPGTTVDNLIGTKFCQYLEGEEKQKEVKLILENVIKTGHPGFYEADYRTADGTIECYESTVAPRTLEGSNEIIGLTVNARRVTERKSIEKALIEGERRLREVASTAKLGGWEIDFSGNTLSWTEETFRIHELDDETPPDVADAIGYYHPEDRQMVADAVKNAVKVGEGFDFEARLITAKKNLKWVNAIGNTVTYQGEQIGLRGMIQDITDRKQIETELVNSNLLLNAVIQSPKDIIIFALDRSYRYTAFNENHAKAMKAVHNVDITIGMNMLEQLNHSDTCKKAKLSYDRALNGESFSEIHKEPELPIYWELFWNPIQADTNEVIGLTCFLQNISDRIETEEQTKASLKEKETLLQEIHHRVKNNMQVISSLLKLQASTLDDEKIKEALSESQNRVFAMSALHEALYSSDNLAEIDFYNYLLTITSSLAQAYNVDPNHIKFNIDSDKIFCNIKIASPLGLTINELVSNSLKHAFPNNSKGEINIIIKKVGHDLMELIIEDDGVGIPPDKDWKESRSLGLRLVRDLVEKQLDGSINLDTGNGTRFTIKIDLVSYQY